MWIARNIAEARRYRRELKGRVALVPTMGALHAGHLSLMESARKLGDQVIASIFVNPVQFGPEEDFERYPRPIEQDLAACEKAGVAGVFHPAADEIYPPENMVCEVDIPSLADILEGKHRPGHFAGVCRVVAKLFHILQPDVACFGQKDYQQLRVLHAMVDGLNFPVTIAELATIREPDGLAMSSRNAYLKPDERRHAVGLFKALSEARDEVEQKGEIDPAVVEAAMRRTLAAHHIEPDYAVVRHPLTLQPIDSINPAVTGPVVALIAGRLGSVRLIDNMLLGATK